ncbi:histidine phosphatase family protein, partial [Rhodanobacter lindaniclasticus]
MGRYLTLVRHGQSTYNASNRFTGWLDPELTDQGVHEAHSVAEQLRSDGL